MEKSEMGTSYKLVDKIRPLRNPSDNDCYRYGSLLGIGGYQYKYHVIADTARAGPKMRTDRDVKKVAVKVVQCSVLLGNKRARPIVVAVRHAFAKISSRPHFIARKPIPVRDGRFRLAVRIRTFCFLLVDCQCL